MISLAWLSCYVDVHASLVNRECRSIVVRHERDITNDEMTSRIEDFFRHAEIDLEACFKGQRVHTRLFGADDPRIARVIFGNQRRARTNA